MVVFGKITFELELIVKLQFANIIFFLISKYLHILNSICLIWKKAQKNNKTLHLMFICSSHSVMIYMD